MSTRVNEALTPALLSELAKAKGPCITAAVRTGGNAKARLRDVLRQIEADLQANDQNVPDRILEPFREEFDGGGGGLIVLSSPEFRYRFETEAPAQEVVVVDEEFHLRSLLPLLSRKVEFYLLALSQNHLRLLHCTEADSGEVGLPPDVPKNFMESRETRQPDHVLDNRSAGGPSTGSMKGVMFGTSSDDDDQNRYLKNYFRAVDRGLHKMLGDRNVPLVVVGVEFELAIYRTVNTYPGFVAPGVHGAPDGLKGGEMHKRALELLASHPLAAVQKQLEHFEKQAGTGHASSHAQEIVKAAYEGRVSHLYLQENADYRGNFDEVRRRVKRHPDGIAPMRDLLNETVVQTLLHGGEVTLLSGKDIPNGVPVCAVFRYPSAELQAAMRENASHGE